MCANHVKEHPVVPENDSLGMTRPHQPGGITCRGKDFTSNQAQDFFQDFSFVFGSPHPRLAERSEDVLILHTVH